MEPCNKGEPVARRGCKAADPTWTTGLLQEASTFTARMVEQRFRLGGLAVHQRSTMQAVSMTDGTKAPADNLSPTPPQEPSSSLHQATLDGEHTGRGIPLPAPTKTLELESGENGGKSGARLIGFAFAIVTCACLGLLLLYAYVATRVEAVGRLSELKELLHEIEALEYRAVAYSGAGQSAIVPAEEAFSEGVQQLEQITKSRLLGNLEKIERVAEQFTSYRSLVSEELRLLGDGRVTEVLTLNEEQTDPTFEQLHEAVTEMKTAYEDQASKAFALATLGSVVIVVASSAAITFLIWRLWHSRATARILGAETMAIRGQERRFRALVQDSSDVIALLQADSTIRFITPASQRLLGLPPEQLVGMMAIEFIHPDDLLTVRSFWRALRDRPSAQTRIQFRWRHADGSWLYLDTTWTNQMDNQAVGAFVVNARDITDQRALEEQLQRQALTDPLTNLANRVLFSNRAQHALTSAVRTRRSVGVLVLDLDDFKAVNDSFGHPVGDEVLVAFAAILRESVRAADTVARIGGDEFAILCEMKRKSDAEAIAQRIIQRLESPFRVQGREIIVSASIGIAISKVGRQSPEAAADQLINNADLAMYGAKARGGGTYVAFDPAIQVTDRSENELMTALRHCVERGELRLHYQPIVTLWTQAIHGFEALLRWQHPERGLLAPAAFIHLAEQTGDIVAMGRWVLQEACGEARRWQQYCPSDPPLRISVNISPRQLRDPGLVQDVATALRDSGLDPHSLILEMTESAILKGEDMVHALFELRELGVELAIDDFGSGYSSLSYLATLPVNIIKLDKPFVDSLLASREDAEVVRTIADLARRLGLQTVAEGVELAQQWTQLQEFGYDYGQGYYYARPMDAQAVQRFLQEITPKPVLQPLSTR